jgi:EmrB/QacA subfamily drug resistance transporter
VTDTKDTKPSAPSAQAGEARTGLALAVIVTGVLITAVDTTIVVLALPEIQRALHIGLSSVIWVIIGYLLVITLLATQVGRLGDMLGRVRMYETGFVIFIIGSALCALAWNDVSIVVFRLVQGVGGALVTANSGAVIADTFPAERRGRAYGFNSIGWSIGAVIGIIIGGLIVTYISWRWIFWINVPIGSAAFVAALRVLHDRGERQRRRIDVAGMLTLGLGLFGVLWAMTKLSTSSADASLLGYLIGGLLMLGVFVVVEFKTAEPMLDLSLFRVPTMTPSLLASMFQGIGSFAVMFLVIMYLQGGRGLRPIDASLLLVPGFALGGLVGPWVGRFTDSIGPVIPATAGLALQAVSFVIYAQFTLSTPLWLVIVPSVINGVGAGAFFPANTSAVMKAAPRRVFGIASGMLRTFANIGMVFSFTVAILVAAHSIPRGVAFAIFVGSTSLHGKLAADFVSGVHAAFYSATALVAVAALLSALRGRRGLVSSTATGQPAAGAAR